MPPTSKTSAMRWLLAKERAILGIKPRPPSAKRPKKRSPLTTGRRLKKKSGGRRRR